MGTHSRYRVEDGRTCIDIRLKSPRQLFDLRDPAPFRERDLDPDAAEHLLTCMREIPYRTPVRIVLYVAPDADHVVDLAILDDAIVAHFEHERTLVNRAIRANFRRGRQLFLVGAGVLALFLSLSHLSAKLFSGLVQEILSEGLVITGWVAMWRPAEVLLYEWWPLYEERRWIDKLIASEVVIHAPARTVTPAAQRSQSPAATEP